MSTTATIPTISEYRELALSAGVADNISDMLLVGGYLYGITATSPSKVIKVDRSTFAYEVATFPNDGNHVNASDIIYVPSNGKLYVAFPVSGRLLITEVDPASLTMTDKVNEVTAGAGVVSMATDDSYLYVLMQAAGNIVTLRQYDLAFLGHIDPDLSNIRGADGLVFYDTGVYFIGWPDGAEATQTIYRVDAADLSVSSTAIASVGANIRRLHHSVVANGRLFFCSEEVANKIVVIELNNLTSQLLNFSAAGDHSALVSDGASIWNLRDNGLAVRINPSTLETSIYTLNAGQGYLSELEGDGTYLYASFFQSATKIARYHIAHTAQTVPQLIGFLKSIGVTGDVAISGNYAFLAGRTFGLSVVDISNPSAPVFMSSVDRPFDGARIAISGPIACVTGSRQVHFSPGVLSYVGVFYIINITDPTRPYLLGSIEDAGSFYGVAIVGNYAYVARGLAGVSVINISNRTNPTIVASHDTSGLAQSITISGNYAYVSDGQAGIAILDISNPLVPASVGSANTPGNAQHVELSGSLAYVADLNHFQIVDVGNPQAPSLKGVLVRNAFDVKVQGSVAYLAAGSTGLLSINVSNPDSLTQTGSLAPFGASSPSTGGVSIVGSVAYLSNGEGGLGIANVSNPAAMSQVSSLREWFSGAKLASKTGLIVLVGNHLSSGGQTSVNGLRAINTSNPSAPFVVGQLEIPGLTFFGVWIAGNHVYAACGSDGVKVIDISNPAQPTVVGSCDTPGLAQSVTVVGNYAYIADGSGLRILDISNPTIPVSVSGIDTSGSARDVAVVNAFAYVAAYNYLHIMDVSDPQTPVLRGSLILTAFEVKVQNGIAYVAAASSGLVTVDVSNPVSPRTLGSILPVGASNPTTASIALNGAAAYVANGSGGLAIIDISNPSSLRLHSTAPTLGYTRSVIAAGRWIYLSDSLAGINIFDVG